MKINMKKIKVCCNYCNKIIFTSNWSLKNYKHHFCNNLCMRKFYKGKNHPRFSKKVLVHCKNCKKDILRKKSHIKKNKFNFCNLKCRSIFYKINLGLNNPRYCKIKVKCLYCKKVIFRKPSRIKKQKNHFCDKDCLTKYQTKQIKISCDVCGKQLFRKISDFKKHKHHFCNKKCYGKSIIGKNNPNYKNITKIHINKKATKKIKPLIKSQKNKEVKIKCTCCKKIIYRTIKRIKKNKNNFCSIKCCNTFYKNENSPNYTKIKVLCKQCKKILFKNISCVKRQKHQFCDRVCFSKWRDKVSKVKVICACCKHTFLRKKCHLKKFKNYFCSNKCRNIFFKDHLPFVPTQLTGKDHPGWNNGSSFEPYGLDFNNNLREFIRKRDKYICQNPNCGIPEKECFKDLISHHIDYNKRNNHPINLIALCQSCHSKSNFSRGYWKTLYEDIQIKRKVHMLERAAEQP